MKRGQKRYKGHVVKVGTDDNSIHTDWMDRTHFFVVEFVPVYHTSFITCVRVYHNIDRLKDANYLLDEYVEIIGRRVGFWDRLEAVILDSIKISD